MRLYTDIASVRTCFCGDNSNAYGIGSKSQSASSMFRAGSDCWTAATKIPGARAAVPVSAPQRTASRRHRCETQVGVPISAEDWKETRGEFREGESNASGSPFPKADAYPFLRAQAQPGVAASWQRPDDRRKKTRHEGGFPCERTHQGGASGIAMLTAA